MMGQDAVAAAGEGDVNAISRGGLIKLSELLYSIHSCFVSSEKTKNSLTNFLKIFLAFRHFL